VSNMGVSGRSCIRFGLVCLAGIVTAGVLTIGGPVGAAGAVVTGHHAQSDQLPAGLLGVSCGASGDCMAVGYRTKAGIELPLAEHLSGEGWHLTETANPAGASASTLDSVYCSEPTVCIAGGYRVVDGETRPLLEIWNGTNWHIQHTAQLNSGEFYGVTCTSTDACIAVGSRVQSDGKQTALAEIWNGTAWKSTHIKFLKDGTLLGVSCISGDDCMAVGDYQHRYPKFTAQTFVEELWNGTTWTNVTPAKTTGAAVYGVSCVSAGSCVTAGYAGDGVLWQVWNASKWTWYENGPQLGVLDAVSCSGPESGGLSAACQAVGSDGADSQLIDPQTLTDTTETTPATGGSLTGVACTDPSDCTAVGYSASGTIAEQWNGSSWAIEPTPELTSG
jgi:hypothetical protein